MKHLKFLSALLIVFMALIACDTYDYPAPEMQTDFGQKLAGNYQGNYSSPLTAMSEDYIITISKIDERNVRITVADFGSFDTGLLVSSEDKEVLISDVSENLLSMTYHQKSKRLLFTRTTKTLGGQIAYLSFDGYKK